MCRMLRPVAHRTYGNTMHAHHCWYGVLVGIKCVARKCGKRGWAVRVINDEVSRGVARVTMVPQVLLSKSIAGRERHACRMCESYSCVTVVESGPSCVTGCEE